MTDFISTNNGKIVNVANIAFLTTRTNPKSVRRGTSKDGSSSVSYRVKDVIPVQLVVAFAAAAESKSGMIPLSLVLEGSEATDFLDQMQSRGVNVTSIREKVSAPAPASDETMTAG